MIIEKSKGTQEVKYKLVPGNSWKAKTLNLKQELKWAISCRWKQEKVMKLSEWDFFTYLVKK